MSVDESLRERKKQATREALSRAGLDLCLRHGYDVVTIADIADAAGVSRRTFFNYFPGKAECVRAVVNLRTLDVIPRLLASDSSNAAAALAAFFAELPAAFWSDVAALHRISEESTEFAATTAAHQHTEATEFVADLIGFCGPELDELKLTVTVLAIIACVQACTTSWARTAGADPALLSQLISRYVQLIDVSWLDPYLSDLRHAGAAPHHSPRPADLAPAVPPALTKEP